MALQIINAGGSDSQEIAERMHKAIAGAIPDAQIEVRPTSTGHFEIRVASNAFSGKTRVAQHQLVYAAITDLMTGNDAPVHAVDRLDCLVPE
jgi:stress-induced morphogen